MDINHLKEIYDKHKNLKIAAQEVGIPWQPLYYHLKKHGHNVVGDKSRYGSDSDRLASKSEREFERIVKNCKNNNRKEYQSKIDFTVGSYGVDVKASNPKYIGKKRAVSWAFSIKKQEILADFFVMFAYNDDGEVKHIFLLPSEVCKNYSTVRVAKNNKWWDYLLTENELSNFFEMLIS